MKKVIKRNYGYGRNLKFAAKQALKSYKGVRYSANSSHISRFSHFATFCKQHNTSNAVYISQSMFENYANVIQKKVNTGQFSTAYAHNLISSVNVVMYAFKRDKSIWLSPLSLFGPKNHVRQIAPNMSFFATKFACREIQIKYGDRIALIIWLARLLGLRLKEAILLDAKNALKQAKKYQFVDIRKGTKGGRGKKVSRLVDVNQRIVFALKLAVIVQSKQRSFIPENEKLITFYRRIHRCAIPILTNYDIQKIHDLRAAFACDEYEKQVGVQAPVISGVKVNKTAEIKEQLKHVSNKLGHGREYVIDSYCGR